MGFAECASVCAWRNAVAAVSFRILTENVSTLPFCVCARTCVCMRLPLSLSLCARVCVCVQLVIA